MAATARISIALPVELKGRMKAAEKDKIINWSKACRQRIESELAVLERRRADETAAVARLQACLAQSDRQDFVEGTELGRKWAYERAPGCVLRRLQKSVSHYEDVWDNPSDRLALVLGVTDGDERLRADLFGEACHDFDALDDWVALLAGFVQGALEAWQELAPHVEGAHRSLQPITGDAEAEDTEDTADLAASIEAQESSGAHPAAQNAHACAATQLTNYRPGRTDSVTRTLAEVAEASKSLPDNSPPPLTRPKLWIVRVAEDTYTTAREWLARERPIDYGS